jgi:2-dehydropantoate 2-reductase
MRFVVVGAGAVGCVVGGRLAEAGHAVVLVGREDQYAAIRECGLRIESPGRVSTIEIPIVEHPAQIGWHDDDIVLLAVKSQHTAQAVEDLYAVAPESAALVCLQNGVENERTALRWFEHVYGVCVMCPASYLTPGVVQAWASPVTGILDIGRYPSGTGKHERSIATVFETATFMSEPRTDIMRWKYTKLLMNLGNAVGAICGPEARAGQLPEMARKEALACFKAAGIEYVRSEEDMARRGSHLQSGSTAGDKPRGGSSWQSLQRQSASIEAGFLNGEVVLLGRLHGVPTPVNALLQRLACQLARERRPPGALAVEEVMRQLEQQTLADTKEGYDTQE